MTVREIIDAAEYVSRHFARTSGNESLSFRKELELLIPREVMDLEADDYDFNVGYDDEFYEYMISHPDITSEEIQRRKEMKWDFEKIEDDIASNKKFWLLMNWGRMDLSLTDFDHECIKLSRLDKMRIVENDF